MLIASRRQVEGADLGGGYVENWTTEEFAQYVRANDPQRLVLLCRDHGGPYQHARDRLDRLDADRAMQSAADSFTEDIRNGFDVLHIDTCNDLDGPASFDDAIDRLVTLYQHCWDVAQLSGHAPAFEVGFEDQGVDTSSPDEFREQIREVLDRLAGARLPAPNFVVAQTGTKVLEAGNDGGIRTTPNAVDHSVRSLSRIAEEYRVALKAHNADYLSFLEVCRLRTAGVHAVNVAPELGVAETRALLQVMDGLGLRAEKNAFVALSYASGLWSKWLSPGSEPSELECAVIAGHYVYSTNEFAELKKSAAERASRHGIDLDDYLRWSVERVIDRYDRALSCSVPQEKGPLHV